MEFVICPKCGFSIKKDRFLKHFRKAHYNLNYTAASALLKTIDISLGCSEKSWDNDRRTIAKSKGKIIDTSPPDYSHLILRKMQRINHKVFLFEREFSSFNKGLYFELMEFRYNRLFKIVNSYLSGIKEEEDQLPEEVKSMVLEIENNMVLDLISKLESFKNTTIDRITFIKEKCETTFITWDDISFDRNKIKISPNKVFVQPIEMPGSIKIYNEIKIDYFKRKYSKDVYKIVSHRGIVMDDLSKGVSQLRSLISEHAADLERPKRNELVQKELTENEFTGNQLLESLNKMAIKNEYLSIAARLVAKTDKVIGIIENNKGKDEEALLYLFSCSNKTLALWENINPNRAAYIFVLETINTSELHRLKTIIKTNIEYKRYNLFIGTNIKKTLNLDCSEYYQLNHFDKYEYSRKLRMLLIKYRN